MYPNPIIRRFVWLQLRHLSCPPALLALHLSLRLPTLQVPLRKLLLALLCRPPPELALLQRLQQ